MVVDGQLALAETLASRLATEDDLYVLGAFGSLDQVGPRLVHGVDLVLLGLDDAADVDSPDGVAGIRQLVAQAPDIRVVVLGGDNDPWLAAEAIEAGVVGWVPKHAGINQLLDTVRGVARDETWIPARLLTGVLHVMADERCAIGDEATVLGRLTARERDVLQSLVDGMSRHQIAEQLRLSPNTVRTHVQHVLSKLGVHSSLTAAAVARDLGLQRRDLGSRPRPARAGVLWSVGGTNSPSGRRPIPSDTPGGPDAV